MAERTDKTTQRSSNDITWAKAFRDIGIALVNFGNGTVSKGQWPFTVLLFIGTIVALRMPPTDLAEIVKSFLTFLAKHHLWGLIFGAAAAIGWTVHIKLVRKEYNLEIARIGVAKSAAQNASGKNFPPSGAKP